jgi:hypothetical protein
MQITSTPAMAANAGQAQSSADLLAESTILTADVGGKTLIADLNLSAGQYVRTLPDYLPPINASPSSLVQAENNLNARISLLVSGSELKAHCQLDSTGWRNSRDLPKRG